MKTSKEISFKNASIRVAFGRSISINEFDPQIINIDIEAYLSKTLYARLVYFNEAGELIDGVADKVEWDGEKYIFHIRKGVYASDGHEITAHDVYLSLLRTMVKKNDSVGTHGDLRMFLCSGANVSSANLECPGIWHTENHVYLQPDDPKKRFFLVPLLASSDFAIIPKDAVDWNSPDLSIKNYHSTSGPYYLGQTDQGYDFVLKANPNSFLYRPGMPDKIQALKVYKDEALDFFEVGKLDFLPAFVGGAASRYRKIAQRDDVTLHITQPIQLTRLEFTDKGRSHINRLNRLKAGLIIRNVFYQIESDPDFIKSIEIFPETAEGGLKPDQLDELKALFQSIEGKPPDQLVTIAISAEEIADYQEALKGVRNIKLVSPKRAPWLLPFDEQPDAYVHMVDSAFYEDYSLLHYFIHTGSFGDKEEKMRWLESYILIESKENRLKELQKLHKEALEEGYIVPFGHSPYYALTRDPIVLKVYDFYAFTPLWNLSMDANDH